MLGGEGRTHISRPGNFRPVRVPAHAIIGLIEARPGTQAVLLGDHGVLAVGPDTETAVSLLVALEEAAEAELRAAALG